MESYYMKKSFKNLSTGGVFWCLSEASESVTLSMIRITSLDNQTKS